MLLLYSEKWHIKMVPSHWTCIFLCWNPLRCRLNLAPLKLGFLGGLNCILALNRSLQRGNLHVLGLFRILPAHCSDRNNFPLIFSLLVDIHTYKSLSAVTCTLWIGCIVCRQTVAPLLRLFYYWAKTIKLKPLMSRAGKHFNVIVKWAGKMKRRGGKKMENVGSLFD